MAVNEFADWAGSWELESRTNWTPWLEFLGVPEAMHAVASKAPDFHRYIVKKDEFVMDHRIPGQGVHLFFTAKVDNQWHPCPYPQPTATLWKDGESKAPDGGAPGKWRNRWVAGKEGVTFETEIVNFAGKGATVRFCRSVESRDGFMKFEVFVLDAEGKPVLGPCLTTFKRTGDLKPEGPVRPDFGDKPLVFVVTGANRGLGLQFVKDILSNPVKHTVLALVRTPGSPALKDLERVHEVQCDVGDAASIEKAAGRVGELVDRIDILINNAGVIGPGIETFESMTKEGMLETYNVNVVGPVLVTQALLPLVRKALGLPKIAMLSSGLSSNVATRKMPKTLTSYACSKAAVNMLVTQLSIGVKDICTVALGPGWCETDLGSSVGKAPHKAENTIPGCLMVLSKLTLEQSGRFINFDGSEVPY